MNHRTLVWIALAVFWSPPLRGQETEVRNCSSFRTVGSGFGVQYRRAVYNDYFTATIPPGLTGWGAGPGAPFHGFEIYFDPKGYGETCIEVDVGIFVDLDLDHPPDVRPATVGTPVRVGDRPGFQQIIHGAVGGKNLENIVNVVLWNRGGTQAGLAITLVTPSSMAAKTRPVLDRFLSSLRFQ